VERQKNLECIALYGGQNAPWRVPGKRGRKGALGRILEDRNWKLPNLVIQEANPNKLLAGREKKQSGK